MPNWCYTNYVAEGPKAQIKRLYDMMVCVKAMPSPGLVENGFGSSWLGNLVAAMGIDPEKFDGRCRGEYYDIEIISDTEIAFTTMTAWCEADDVRHLIENKYPGVKLWYISEEFGCNYWETNDIDGKYFTDRYYCRIDDTDEETYFSDLSEVVQKVEKYTGDTLLTYQDVEIALNRYDEERDDDDCSTLLQVEFDNGDC